MTITVLSGAAVLVRRHAAAGLDLGWPVALAWQAAVYASWIPFAAAAAWLARRWTGFRPWRALGLYLAAVAATAAHTIGATALDIVVSPAAAPSDWPRLVESRAPVDLLIATALVAAVAAYELGRRRSALAGELRALEAAVQAARAAPASAPERLAVSLGDRRLLLDAQEVEWFGSAGNYVVVNWNGREGLLRETLAGLAARLDSAVFARVHRTAVANLARVRETASLSDGSWRLTMTSGAELVVSRTYRAAVLKQLGVRA